MAQSTATDIPITSSHHNFKSNDIQSTPVLRPCNTLPDRMPHEPEHRGHRPRLASLGVSTSDFGGPDHMALFAGRLGGNQSFVVDRNNPANAELLQKLPDAAPNLSLQESFNLRGFREADLYKAAVIEFVGESAF